MARTALQKVYADFRQGFVTVANPLAYPEGTLKDIVNFDIKDNVTLELRPGLQQESLTTAATGLSLSEINDKALSAHLWKNVSKNGERKIAVIQVGSKLYLFEATDDGIDTSNELSGVLDLGISSDKQDIKISSANGGGWFFIAHPSIKPKILKEDSGTFTLEDIDIKVRDLSLWRGRNDQETGLVNKSTTLYPQHEYNLRNGGWPYKSDTSNSRDPDEGTSVRDPVRYTETRNGWYPPVYVPFSLGKAGGGSNLTEQNAYSPWAIRVDYLGNSLIPLGRNIVNAESWSREGNGDTKLDSSVPSSNNFSKTYEWESYPSCIEFYSGRVWYAGVKGYKESQTSGIDYEKKDNLDVTNTIYFSQTLNSDLGKVGLCYQENDPTAEDINQLLATDGGTISLSGAGEIYDIKTFGTSLVVFCSEGVWSISGTDANSFKADSFSVNKISNIGPSSKTTISATNNNLYYIANDAIYILVIDEVTGLPSPKDITSSKIKDFYTNIPYSAKKKSIALYDTAGRTFFMFYTDEEDLDISSNNLYYNKCLIFNQDLGSFYKYELSITNRYIVDGIFYNKDKVISLEELIYVDDEVVTLEGGEPVVLVSKYSTASLNSIQLLTVVDEGETTSLAFSSFTDVTTRSDWGEPYTGYAELGFDSAGDIMRDSVKAPVIISHMKRTETGYSQNPDTESGEVLLENSSSCLLYYGWDWATSYKNPIQIYRFTRNYIPSSASDPFNYGKDVVTTRNRIRGKGHSLGIKLQSEEGKDCKLLGIGILYTVAQDI